MNNLTDFDESIVDDSQLDTDTEVADDLTDTEEAEEPKKKVSPLRIILFVVIAFLLFCGFHFLGCLIRWSMRPPIDDVMFHKPVMYIYNDTCISELSISVSRNGAAPKCVYPRLSEDNFWHIQADKDSDITANNREYNYLYWEDTTKFAGQITQGYCIKGEDTIEFLEWALAELGLTDKEADDFITYWLPKMQYNSYNLIQFNSQWYFDTYQHTVDRQVDNFITAYMLWQSSDSFVELQEQDLEAMNNHNRTGLTIVEWGGIELPATK